MPEQESVLTLIDIKSLLDEKYHINVTEIISFNHSSANCFHILDGNKSYFLKEYQSRFNKLDLAQEANLIKYLIKNNYPTAKIIPTSSAEYYIKFNDRFLMLQEWIDGKTYTDNKLPYHLLIEAAQLLGKLHNILHNYSLPHDMDKKWLEGFHLDRAAAQYNQLLNELEKQKNNVLYDRIKNDLLYKRDLVYLISEYKKYYEGITYCATHGDFTCFQYICDTDYIKAIIDFSSARTLPVVWEIMRSYVQSTGACMNGAKFNTDEFCHYVSLYLINAPLTKTDLRAMPYVYLYQLARSKFGYNEYLVTNSKNKNDLINFAFWRTDICREIYAKKEEISKKLCALL